MLEVNGVATFPVPSELWVIVDRETREPILSQDCNEAEPGKGQTFLVALTERDAWLAVAHQLSEYDVECDPIRIAIKGAQ